jgi:hypothetical protein
MGSICSTVEQPSSVPQQQSSTYNGSDETASKRNTKASLNNTDFSIEEYQITHKSNYGKIQDMFNLRVELIEGTNISASHRGTETVNPLVEVWVNGFRGNHKFVGFTSGVDNLQCEANSLNFQLVNPEKSVLVFEVWTEDDGAQKSAGLSAIMISRVHLDRSRPHDLWVPLKTKTNGRLHLRLTASDFECKGNDKDITVDSTNEILDLDLLLHQRRTSRSDDVYDKKFDAIFVEDLIKTANTGDVLAYSGTAAASRTIQLGSFSMWSHVATIVRNPSQAVRDKYNLGNEYNVFALESDVPTLDRREGGGIQLTEFQYWWREAYMKLDPNCLMVLRRIKRQETFDWGDAKFYEPAITEFLLRVHNRPYEKFKIEMIMALYDLNVPRANDRDSYFCSELVTDMLKAIKAVPESVIINNVIPKEVTADSPFLNKTACKGVSWSNKMLRLKWKNSFDTSLNVPVTHKSTVTVFADEIESGDILNVSYFTDYHMSGGWIGAFPKLGNGDHYEDWAYTSDTPYGSLSFPVKSTTNYGDWELRLFGTNDTSLRLATCSFKLTPRTSTDIVKLKASQYTVTEGEVIKVTWDCQSVQNVGKGAWIGAFKKQEESNNFKIWGYTDDAVSGLLDLTMSEVEVGDWEIRYLSDRHSYNAVAKIPIKVISSNK